MRLEAEDCAAPSVYLELNLAWHESIHYASTCMHETLISTTMSIFEEEGVQ
jgi:hypothetical protein